MRAFQIRRANVLESFADGMEARERMRLADEAAALRSARSAAVGPTGETSMDALGSSLVRGGLGYMAPDARRVEQAEQIAAMQRGLEMRAQLLGPTADRPEMFGEASDAVRAMGLPSMGLPRMTPPAASPQIQSPARDAAPMEASPARWPAWFSFGRGTNPPPEAIAAAAEMGAPYAQQVARAARDESMAERMSRTAGYLASQEIARERLALAKQQAGMREQERAQDVAFRRDQARREETTGDPGFRALIQQLPQLQEQARDAGSGINRIDQMMRLLEAGAGGRIGVLQAGLSRLGIPVTEGMTEAATYQLLSETLRGPLRVDIVGPGPMTEAEQRLLGSVTGGGNTAPAAARQLLAIYRDMALNRIRAYNEAVNAAGSVSPTTRAVWRPMDIPGQRRMGGGGGQATSGAPAAAPRIRGIRTPGGSR